MADLLASDTWTIPKVFELLLLILALFALVFFSTNIPELMSKAQLFWWLLISGFILIGFGFLIPKVGDFEFNVPLWEESPVIPEKYDKFLLVGFLLIGLATLFFIGRTGYAISAPEFQILELGYWGNGILSFFAAFAEDIIFFGCVPALIFGVVYYVTKNFPLSVFLVVVVTPLVFVIYHTYHYGFEDIVSTSAVYIFGLELSVAMVVLRKLFYAHMRHGFNNMSIVIFKYMTMEALFVWLLSNLWFWVVIIVVAVSIFYVWRRKK